MNNRQQNRSLLKEELDPVNIEKVLKEKGYNSREILELIKKDVLFISTNFKEQELLTLETVEAKKILANEAKSLKIDFPLDKKGHRYIELLHAEIYIGLIVFLSLTAWEIAKGILSNWLYDKFKGMKRNSKTLYAELEIQIVDKEKERIHHIKYKGPANEIGEIMKKSNSK